jgi:multiple sugar transport system permease protein
MQSSSAPQKIKKTESTTLAQRKFQDALTGYAFMAPSIFILFLFFIVPLLVSVYFSTTNWNGIRPLFVSETVTNADGTESEVTIANPEAYESVGFENYTRLLHEGRRVDEFYTAFKNTFYYALGVVPLQTMFALILAVIMNQKWLKGRGFFRTAFYFPSITSSVVISLIFIFLFSTGGPVNGLIKAIFPNYENIVWLDDANGIFHSLLGIFGITRDTLGAFGQTEIFHLTIWDWISGPSVTMFTIMMLAVWTTIGTMMVTFLAALQNVPSSVYEAASVDGATGWQQFVKITLPILRPTTFFVVTIGMIGAFQVFDQVYVISKGEPQNTTLTLAYLVYQSAFDPTNPRMGAASATAIVLFIIILSATIIQRRVTGGDQAND